MKEVKDNLRRPKDLPELCICFISVVCVVGGEIPSEKCPDLILFCGNTPLVDKIA